MRQAYRVREGVSLGPGLLLSLQHSSQPTNQVSEIFQGMNKEPPGHHSTEMPSRADLPKCVRQPQQHGELAVIGSGGSRSGHGSPGSGIAATTPRAAPRRTIGVWLGKLAATSEWRLLFRRSSGLVECDCGQCSFGNILHGHRLCLGDFSTGRRWRRLRRRFRSLLGWSAEEIVGQVRQFLDYQETVFRIGSINSD
jgi:hypothetical protein